MLGCAVHRLSQLIVVFAEPLTPHAGALEIRGPRPVVSGPPFFPKGAMEVYCSRTGVSENKGCLLLGPLS